MTLQGCSKVVKHANNAIPNARAINTYINVMFRIKLFHLILPMIVKRASEHDLHTLPYHTLEISRMFTGEFREFPAF